MLSLERQNGSWSTWKDAQPPAGFANIMEINGTDPTKFSQFMGTSKTAFVSPSF
jgi:hypothetical protein